METIDSILASLENISDFQNYSNYDQMSYILNEALEDICHAFRTWDFEINDQLKLRSDYLIQIDVSKLGWDFESQNHMYYWTFFLVVWEPSRNPKHHLVIRSSVIRRFVISEEESFEMAMTVARNRIAEVFKDHKTVREGIIKLIDEKDYSFVPAEGTHWV